LLRIFIAVKNTSPRLGFKLANLGSNGKHANHYTTEVTSTHFCYRYQIELSGPVRLRSLYSRGTSPRLHFGKRANELESHPARGTGHANPIVQSVDVSSLTDLSWFIVCCHSNSNEREEHVKPPFAYFFRRAIFSFETIPRQQENLF
jgi:hypothetical protein